MGSRVKTKESGKMFRGFESMDVGNLGNEGGGCGGTEAGDGLEEDLFLCFVVFQLSVNNFHFFSQKSDYFLIHIGDGSMDDGFFVLYICCFSLHVPFHDREIDPLSDQVLEDESVMCFHKRIPGS